MKPKNNEQENHSSSEQSEREEQLNYLTHGVGLLFSFFGFVTLAVITIQEGNPWKIISSIIYGITLISVYTSSTLYHSASNVKRKRLFRKADHVSIYLLIAGSYTPFALVALPKESGLFIMITVWLLAIIGIFLKLFHLGRYPIITTTMYLVMGWLAVLVIKPLGQHLPAWGLQWLIAGGLSYTIGVVFYVRKKPFNHVIWHLFVLAGSVCHFMSVFSLVS